MPDTPAVTSLERLARGISSALTIRLISGDTDQTYTTNEVATMVEAVINEQLARTAAAPEGTRLVLMSEELALQFGASRVEWGEPDEHGWYTPTLYRDSDGYTESICIEEPHDA